MTEQTELTLFTPRNPLTILTDREEFDKFYEEIRQAVADFEPDTTTQKGRDAIKALAFKVTKTKTYLDSEGKRLTEEKRHEIDLVDASRRHMRQQLEALKDEVRAPLDRWEAEEEARVKAVAWLIAGLTNSALIPAAWTFDDALAELEKVKASEINEAFFRERTKQATELRQIAIDNLTAALDRLKREEEERAELARLRAEKEERERAEQERRAAEEEQARQVARAKAANEEAERRAAETKAREERLAQVAADARARELEERHQAELRQERQARERAEEAERQRREEEIREAAEQAKRDADKKHRREVMTAAKDAIMERGVEEEKAKTIVLAIIAGEIPNVTLRF